MVQTIFVTGTNSGIGKATVELFASRGWQVAATVRKAELLNQFSSLPNVRTYLLDVSHEGDVQRVTAEAIADHGPFDVVVNNAGYLQMGPLETSSMAQIRAQLDTNLFGSIAIIKAFLPSMRARGGGVIVNVSSITGEVGYPFCSAYSASKAALTALSEACSIELDATGVKVKAIIPGLHATKIFSQADTADALPDQYRPFLDFFLDQQEKARGGAPSAVASAIWDAVHDTKKEKVRYFVGADARSLPLLRRLLGQYGYWKLFRNTLLEGPNALVSFMMKRGEPVDFGTRLRLRNGQGG